MGLTAAGVLAAAAATAAFCAVIGGWWGRRRGAVWYFAAATGLAVAIGQLPYLSGEALGLGALWALRRRRPLLGALLALGCALFSGVDGVFLAVAVGGWALSRRRLDRRNLQLVTVAVIPVAASAAIALLFPGTGMFPYPVGGLIWVLAACALFASPAFREAPALRVGAAAYAAMAVIAFAVPSPMGGNANRLAQVMGVPVLACFVPRWRGAATRLVGAGVVVALAAWAWAPGLDLVSPAASGPATTAAFYRPLLAQLEARSGRPVRVEIPPTRQHWESVYVAARYSLARGWERQIDTADNPLFYTAGPLNPVSYASWLKGMGVSYVALPDAPLDYAGRDEALLLRSGRVPGLRLVWRTPRWRLWAVEGSPGLVTGPGQLRSVGPGTLVVDVARPGRLTVRFRSGPYWSVAAGDACVERSPGGWIGIRARRAGTVDLRAVLIGGRGRCPALHRPAPSTRPK